MKKGKGTTRAQFFHSNLKRGEISPKQKLWDKGTTRISNTKIKIKIH
jgi:hypothetical protein